MTAYNVPNPPSLWATNSLTAQIEPQISIIPWNGGAAIPISGPLAPVLGAENGVNISEIHGLMAPIKHQDQQGATQDGTTWGDSVRDPLEIDFMVEISGNTPAEFRRVKRQWFDAWHPKKLNRFVWFTPEMGEWWCDVRQFKEIVDSEKFSPSTTMKASYQWSARNDDAFWRSFDSVTDTATYWAPGQTSGFLPQSNRGTEEAWPRYLVTGPGTFSFGDVGGKTITFGPLLAGQRVLITTLPRLRSVVDVSASAPTQQQLNEFQALLKAIVDFATNNNVPPLLQDLESAFGILPPQGVLYSLLKGRFTTPIPPATAAGPTQFDIPVSWTGGDANTRVIAATTPFRSWPE